MGSAALIFLVTFALDVVWARYTVALVARRIGPASMYAAGITALSGVCAISYVENHWMLLPAVAGAAVGTAAGMRRGH
jgi:hypothetical protein